MNDRQTTGSRVPVDPDSVGEADFTEARLESVFTSHFGPVPRGRRMRIGGIEVTRRVTPNRSNSGKIKGWHISFIWTGSDGEQHQVPDPSTRILSRKNDPNRNWGMKRGE
jgi:hypothetical protein